MSGLRETKKAATRANLARAAARLVLEEGVESLTVAAVSEAAGVSPRTFHNYFASMDEALHEFILHRVSQLVEQLSHAPADAGVFEAVEWVILENLRTTGPDPEDLDSFATLFRIGDVLVSLRGLPALRDRIESMRPVIAQLRARATGLDDFEAMVAVTVAATVAQTALEKIYAHPGPRDPAAAEEVIRRAFAVVRLA